MVGIDACACALRLVASGGKRTLTAMKCDEEKAEEQQGDRHKELFP
jgi:hypothetical protein